MTCQRCGKPIDPRRLKFLPDTRTCAACSTERKIKTHQHYSHKTGGFMVAEHDHDGHTMAVGDASPALWDDRHYMGAEKEEES